MDRARIKGAARSLSLGRQPPPATHALCEDCYAAASDVGLAKIVPQRLAPGVNEVCCGCGTDATSGLYLLAAGAFTNCDHERRFAQGKDTAE